MSITFRIRLLIFLVLVAVLHSGLPGARSACGQGQSIDFIEKYAMADDRASALAELVPGTEEFYFYHCLYYQSQQQFEQAEAMLKDWNSRLGRTARMQEIRHRQALLQYDTDPEQTLEYLIGEFKLRFDHQRQRPSAEPGLPSALNPDLIARQRLLQRALRHDDTRRVETRGLRSLAGVDLSDSQLRNLLMRLQRPDIPNLPELVARDLGNRDSQGFGSMPIQKQMLKSQLDELLEIRPGLLNAPGFVNIYLSKLLPNDDVDWQINRTAHVAYLDRLWEFADRLNDSHNSLKANILFRRLELDRRMGVYDRTRFERYLQLPRQMHYVREALIRGRPGRTVANLAADYSGSTRLPPVFSDEQLVKDYLQHFLVEDDWQVFADWVDEDFLKQQFAEARITAGLGDNERWASLLSPAEYKALIERVDLDFLPTNPQFHTIDDKVELELVTKNVGKLIVKIYQINTSNFYRQYQREVGTDINLDGLVPNWQETYQYDEPPALRVRRKFTFDQLAGRGVYIIDFIGNGTSSRALVRKGKLTHLVETTAAGQLFTILDEQRQRVTDARLWIAGKQFRPEPDGRILVPFTTRPGREQAIVDLDGFHSLLTFNHVAETCHLSAGLYVDRESLLLGKQARAVVRPRLTVAGAPAPLDLLEAVRLEVRAVDEDGVESTRTFDNLDIGESGETTVDLQVPPRLQTLNLTLHAEVKNVSLNQNQSLQVSQTFQINLIDKSDSLQAVHLRQNDTGYFLSVRGKSGEVRSAQAVLVRLKPADFTETVDVRLQTDESGEIALGGLDGIVQLTAELAGNPPVSWPLPSDHQTRYDLFTGLAGRDVVIPASATGQAADDYSLLEVRGSSFVTDHSEAIKVAGGLVTLQGLPPGNYDLMDHTRQRTTRVLITEGREDYGFALGSTRDLEIRDPDPLHVVSIDRTDDTIRVRLGGTSEATRVHVLATRYLPRFSLFDEFARVSDIEPLTVRRGWLADAYLAGRAIGEEYQYILDRQFARKFPGNMLVRPSLLLSPWALRNTENEVQVAEAGDEFGRQESAMAGDADRKPKADRADGGVLSDFASLDYLLAETVEFWNLRPDENGLLEIDAGQLGDKQFVRIVTTDDRHTVVRTRQLPGHQLRFRDLRLSPELALDPQGNFTRQKQYTVLPADQMFEMQDIGSSRFQQYDTLGDVYRYFLTASGNATLQEFAFLMEWPEMTDEEKFDLYTRYACHELNFFLMHKDPAYFQSVILPYLTNKFDPTFLDEYLLSRQLDAFLDPWAFGRLNTVEKIMLGTRISARRNSIEQFLQDDYANHPTRRRAFDRMFEMAVAGSALDVAGLDARFRAQAMREKNLDREADGESLMLGTDTRKSDPVPVNASPPAGRGVPLGDDSARRALEQAEATANQIGGKFNQPENMEKIADGAEDLYFGAEGGGGGLGASRGRPNSLSAEQLGRMRQQLESFYRRLPATREWVENNYYHLPIEQQTAELIRINRFWRDLAEHDSDQPFLSPYFPEAGNSFTEMVMALAVLDLPFEQPENEMEFVDNAMQLTPQSDLIAFFEQVRPAVFEGGGSRVLVSENFFRKDDRYQVIDGQKHEKFIRDEFLPHILYGGQVVVTNPTSMPQDVDLLIQIPEGSLTAAGSQRTRSLQIDLEPFSTQTLEYHFYFPTIGDFTHFPAHVSLDDRVVAVADGLEFHVIAEPSQVDTGSWAWVSQNGTPEQVIEFLETGNLQRIDLAQIAFRMKDPGFFQQTLDTLRNRLAWNDTLWSYGLMHNNRQAITQYLEHASKFLVQCGPWLECELIDIRPVQRHWYQHREYWPLINARVHQLGPQRKILNDQIWKQYHQLLDILARQTRLDDHSRLAMTYYYLLQDRVADALGQFERVNQKDDPTRLPYDYMAAYLAMYEADTDRAATIASRYRQYPVKRWRELFASLLAQVNEIRGGPSELVDADNQLQAQTVAASRTPDLDFVVESRQVRLDYQNIGEVTVNYYLMDVELLFSRNPFVQQQDEGFAMIRPNATRVVKLDDSGKAEFDLPEEFRTSNVLVEISGGGVTRSHASYANSMNVRMIERFGQLQVAAAENRQPLPKMYVKVYARQPDGSVHFYKDGYTDLRGRFDYASLSNQNLDSVDQFAILVIDQDYGAVVREAGVPKE